MTHAPTPEALEHLAADLPSLDKECLAKVPAAWQAALAVATCQAKTGTWAPPGTWAVEALLRAPLAEGDPADARVQELICLTRRAATSGEVSPAALAAALVRLTDAVPSVGSTNEPNAVVLALFDTLIAERPTTDTVWWQAFWDGLRSGGQSLRSHLYFAIGTKDGLDGLWAFLEKSLHWEDTATRVGSNATRFAAQVLSRFQTRGVPPPERLLHPSARVRMVALYSAPVQYLTAGAEVRWLGAPEVRARMTEMLAQPLASGDRDDEGWRTAFLGNAWALAGFDAAREDLERALLNLAPDAPHFDQPNVTRVIAALLAIQLYEGNQDPRFQEQAEAIRGILVRAIARAKPAELDRLVLGLKPLLTDAWVRPYVLTLLSDRLTELGPKASSILRR